jgi:electron transport complex protein RnfD
MSQETPIQPESNPTAPAQLHVAPGPHLQDLSLTTRRMMYDVLIAMIPLAVASILVFQWYAVQQLAVCILACAAAEALFAGMRKRRPTLLDGSAAVTGAILAFSLPAQCPPTIAIIACVVAIGLGKMIFGGLGFNLFNPAMVGRAFVMLAFATFLGAASTRGYCPSSSCIDVMTQATPMTALKEAGAATPLWNLFLGNTNGSLGETSALACLLGGAYLLIRRTADWRIPLGVLVGAGLVAGGQNLANPSNDWTILNSLCGGALLFGAFFIATDPVSSPVTHKGKFLFGLGLGLFVMLIRSLSSYPEGVMFAVLLMNAITPLLNRWTVPKPFGGPIPAPAPKA